MTTKPELLREWGHGGRRWRIVRGSGWTQVERADRDALGGDRWVCYMYVLDDSYHHEVLEIDPAVFAALLAAALDTQT